MDNLQLAQVIQEGFRDVKKDLDEIKNRLTVLEKHSIQDIYTMVKAPNKNTRNLESNLAKLTEKVATHECLLNRIEKEIDI
jgi:hypothetical protein